MQCSHLLLLRWQLLFFFFTFSPSPDYSSGESLKHVLAGSPCCFNILWLPSPHFQLQSGFLQSNLGLTHLLLSFVTERVKENSTPVGFFGLAKPRARRMRDLYISSRSSEGSRFSLQPRLAQLICCASHVSCFNYLRYKIITGYKIIMKGN